MEVRELTTEELDAGLALAWTVFQQFEAPEYSEQGVQSFYDAIHDTAFVGQLRMYGAFVNKQLVGVLATRSEGTHIALFFVEEVHQHKGVGKQLFQLACAGNSSDKLTVHSSPCAVEIYRRLGFRETAPEQLTDGVRYTPMECRLRNADCPCKRAKCSRHGNCVACREYHGDPKQNPAACQRTPRRERRRRER